MNIHSAKLYTGVIRGGQHLGAHCQKSTPPTSVGCPPPLPFGEVAEQGAFSPHAAASQLSAAAAPKLVREAAAWGVFQSHVAASQSDAAKRTTYPWSGPSEGGQNLLATLRLIQEVGARQFPGADSLLVVVVGFALSPPPQVHHCRTTGAGIQKLIQVSIVKTP